MVPEYWMAVMEFFTRLITGPVISESFRVWKSPGEYESRNFKQSLMEGLKSQHFTINFTGNYTPKQTYLICPGNFYKNDGKNKRFYGLFAWPALQLEENEEEILLKELFLDPSFQKVFNVCVKVLPLYVWKEVLYPFFLLCSYTLMYMQ